jgi:hypothetical protein
VDGNVDGNVGEEGDEEARGRMVCQRDGRMVAV